MLIALVSAKGSPGVTTTALGLTVTAAPRPRLLVELDPGGGDLELLTGRPAAAGLPRVVASLRHGVDPARIRAEVTEVIPGAPAILAQPGGTPTEATLVNAADRIGPALAELDELVFADAGRWSHGQRTASRIDGAGVVGVVCQPHPASVEHARWLVDELRTYQAARVVVLVVGERPYRIGEVRGAFGVPVLGPIPADPTGVGALYAGGSDSWRWRFTLLGRALPGVLDELLAEVGEVSGVA